MPKAKIIQDGLLDSWGRRNRKIADKKCEACGVEYRPKRESSRFCSKPCMRSKNGGRNKKKESWWKNSKGYIEGRVWIDDHTQVYVKQHRWIMEQHFGVKLDPNDDVHHINGVKDDNRIENLEIIPHGEHTKSHNLERECNSGYKININKEERERRSEQAKKSKALARKSKKTTSKSAR